jgi:DNA polymerase IV
MASLRSFPRAIVHVDADAFFASAEQARNPSLRGRPVITGKERGIASSMSYEAKARGVVRAMTLGQVRELCPDAIILPSDYETYSLLSKRLFDIVRRYTPDVEEYSIDECFADLTGLRRTYRTSYQELARRIKHDLDTELGCTFSVGLAPNKVVAKIASKWAKPSGLTLIPARDIPIYTKKLSTEKIWGIGPMTAAFLGKYRIYTALQFSNLKESWVKTNLSKPYHEIWRELNGELVNEINTIEKSSYQSIQKMKTFTPPSRDREFVFAQLSKNIENACMKARRYKLAAAGAYIFLRTQSFHSKGVELKFAYSTCFPDEMLKIARPAFDAMYKEGGLYRASGIVLYKLDSINTTQLDLFGTSITTKKKLAQYKSIDNMRMRYGKHTLFLGASFKAHRHAQHEGDRGATALRTEALLPYETSRRRIGIPMFTEKLK